MSIHEGDQVEFKMGANTLTGTVENVLTEPALVGDRIAHASQDQPRYDINYGPTGTHFIRTEGAINPVDSDAGSSSYSGSASHSGSGSSSHSHSHSSGGSGQFKEGEQVTFNIGRNELQGTVTDVITEPQIVGDRIAHASKDDPRYAVHYDATGSDMIRTGDSIQHS
eukprot:TRINITY_DN122_c0_g1_i2.p1 TRINITY_DN122_c0_g1~~TRINITY_DN122_c0_g1_i2.p1  ORF type:complete len:178 (-),score=30.91 TRINITY_DN122_c0_g1_i2:32-532(-)